MNAQAKAQFNNYTPGQLRDLYQNNAATFAELAEEAIKEACIGRTPNQTLKLQQLQWTLNARLRKAKTPLGRMQIMENIFYSQVYGGDGHLAKLKEECVRLVRIIRGTERVSRRRPKLYLTPEVNRS